MLLRKFISSIVCGLLKYKNLNMFFLFINKTPQKSTLNPRFKEIITFRWGEIKSNQRLSVVYSVIKEAVEILQLYCYQNLGK